MSEAEDYIFPKKEDVHVSKTNKYNTTGGKSISAVKSKLSKESSSTPTKEDYVDEEYARVQRTEKRKGLRLESERKQLNTAGSRNESYRL